LAVALVTPATLGMEKRAIVERSPWGTF